MAIISRAVGLAIVLGVIGLLVVVGGERSVFINVSALVYLAGILPGGLLLSFRPLLILRALGRSLTQQEEAAPEKLAQYIAVLDRAAQLAWTGGLLLFMLGLIQTLGFLEDASQISVAVAMGLVPLLYGVVLAELVFNALKHSLIAASPAAYVKLDGRQKGNSRAAARSVATACLLVVAVFLALFFAYCGSPPSF